MQRLLKTWRWGIVFAVIFLVVWQSVSLLLRYSVVIEARPNIWDAFFSVYGNWSVFILSVVFPLLLFFLLGDIIVRDTQNGYMQIVLSRLRFRSSWWLGKCLAVISISAIFVGLVLFLSISVGAARGLPIEFTTSSLIKFNGYVDPQRMAQFGVNFFVINPFYVGMNSVLHTLFLICLLTMSYSMIVLLGVSLGAYAKNVFVPTGIAIFVTQFLSIAGADAFSSKLFAVGNVLVTSFQDSAFRIYPGTESELVPAAKSYILLTQQETILLNSVLILLFVVLGGVFLYRKEFK